MMTKQTVRVTMLAVAAFAALYFLWLVRSGLYPFVIALFLAYMINPVVCRLEQRGLGRLWAIVCIYLVVFGTVIVGAGKLLPFMVRELELFGQELPQMTGKADEMLQMLQSGYQNAGLPASMRDALDQTMNRMEGDIQLFVASLAQGIVNLLSYIIGLAVSPVLAFYLLYDWYAIKDTLLALLPGRWRPEIVSIFKDINKVLNGVIRGQILIAVAVGVLVSVSLHILNVKYALLIGILAGVLDVIPYFGAIIGAAPAVLMALLSSPWLAVKVAVLFLVIHQLEGSIIQPQIMGESVGLHPISVIFFVFIGGELGGLIGMLISVPMAAIGKVLICHVIKWLV